MRGWVTSLYAAGIASTACGARSDLEATEPTTTPTPAWVECMPGDPPAVITQSETPGIPEIATDGVHVYVEERE